MHRIDIHDFHSELNALNSDIIYTFEYSECSLPFLDMLVKLKDKEISTDIFFKSTDSHNYLDFYSSHAKHTKIIIPFNLASRLVTIVSDEHILEKRFQDLFLIFNSIKNANKKALFLHIQKLRVENRKDHIFCIYIQSQ